MPIFDFIQNPIIPSQQNASMNMGYQQQIQPYNQYQQQIHQNFQPPIVPSPQNAPIPTVSGGGYGFTVKPDDDSDQPSNNTLVLKAPIDNEAIGVTEKKRGRKRKEHDEIVNSSEIIRAEGTVEDTATINTYAASTMLLNNTLEQLDTIASEVKNELDQVRGSRTLKGKYNYIIGLSANLSSIIGTKAQVIREINNVISKANEMDYKREKDRNMVADQQNDDKYIMDLYNAFIKNPLGVDNNNTILGPNPIQTTLGNSIVRAPLTGQKDNNQSQIADAGYLNYLSNVSPEQNMMFYEQDPNVKTCVVFDASTGNKFFQVMNVATGQVIPNVPVLDNRFMEDTTIDLKNKIAKNNNLNDSYPVIVINDNITKEY